MLRKFLVGLYLMVLGVVCAAVYILVVRNILLADYEDYLSESACVRKHIAQQVERSDISTGDGKCWLNK